MADSRKYLLKKHSGEVALESDEELLDLFRRGQCKVGDPIYVFEKSIWVRCGDLPAMLNLCGARPAAVPEKKLVYFIQAGAVPQSMGPFSTKEMQQRLNSGDLCENSWVFVEGDKEWRQLNAIRVLHQMLPKLPEAAPAAQPAPAPPKPPMSSAPQANMGENSNPSIRLDLDAVNDLPPSSDPVEREDPTMAISTLGLSVVDHSAPPAEQPPPAPSRPLPKIPSAPAAAMEGLERGIPNVNPPSPPAIGSLQLDGASPKMDVTGDSAFDGITAEIPSDAIWMIKAGPTEALSGPLAFLDVIKFLGEGRITKNDKISKAGTNRFVKIAQQYEFNVKYSIETVVEKGVERKKILIKRRHPRVPYFTEVQILTKAGFVTGNCVNVSAGGILMEISKASFNLGDILEIKMLPGFIKNTISCKALVIGKIPKMPPGYALKFEDLKQPDKEAIEFFVQEALKREMSN